MGSPRKQKEVPDEDEVDYNDPRVAGAAPVEERLEAAVDGGEDETQHQVPADPDRPTDDREGNTLSEPSPGD